MARRTTSGPGEVKTAAPSGAVKRAKGARRGTPSPETLAELGPERLIALILGETARNAAFKKLVSAALAALQGPDAVAAIVDRRLTALEGARGYVDWQKRRAFTADLDATVTVILSELRPLDPAAALDRLLRFLDGADAVLARVDDSAGTTQGVYERASDAAVEIAGAMPAGRAEGIALALVPRFAADPYGPFGALLRDLIPKLPGDALAPLDLALAEAADGLPKPKAAAGLPGEVATFRRDLHRGHILRARQDIADRRGDVDGFIALETAIVPEQPDLPAVAGRLLAAGRPHEALAWIRRPQKPGLRIITNEELAAGRLGPDGPDRERLALEIRILDALGRGDEAQDLRWRRFETALDAGMLRDHLAKLPDFEDEEALERAFDHAARHADRDRALAFLVAWPNLPRAARLVAAHWADWSGERYRVLAQAADALEQDHPTEAVLLFRRLLDDILGQGRSNAYPHGARYLARLDALADRLEPGSLMPDAKTYRDGLRKMHGRKYGFWSLLKS